jgi:short-subunit dehydrogenase
MSRARYVDCSSTFSASSDALQTVLITGASEGMGKSVAKQLAQKGANILIVARNVGKLEEALSEIKVSSPLGRINSF